MKLKHLIICILGIIVFAACKNESQSTWDKYAEWRERNVSWIEEQAALRNPDGSPLYTRIVPEWNSNAYVLMRWFNDRSLTAGNYSPLYTSTVDVKYIGRLITDQPFDSSYTSISPADSIRRCKLSGVIPGWTIALESMHVGDSVEVLIPYEQAYGSNSSGGMILPYSALKFNIKLTNIAGEYIRPGK